MKNYVYSPEFACVFVTDGDVVKMYPLETIEDALQTKKDLSKCPTELICQFKEIEEYLVPFQTKPKGTK